MSSDDQIDKLEDDLCTIERSSAFKSVAKESTDESSSTTKHVHSQLTKSNEDADQESDNELNRDDRQTDRNLDKELDRDHDKKLESELNRDHDKESELDRETNRTSIEASAGCEFSPTTTELDQQSGKNQLNSPSQLQVQDDNSSTSSSHPPADVLGEKGFKPNYVVAVLPSELEVDDYSVYYVIKAISIGKTDESKSDSKLNKPVQEMIVKRDFDDFLYLNHVLINSAYPGYGLIHPPLPNKPNLDDDYLATQEVLFNRNALLTNLLYDEQWQKECWFLEQYLHSALNHPTLGKDPFWQRFLMVTESAPKIKLKRNGNLFTSLFTSESQDLMASSLKAVPPKLTHPDCDDWFGRERAWLHYFQFLLKESLDCFNSRMQARSRLCNTLEHLSSTLSLNFATDEGLLSRILSKLNNTFSKSLVEQSNAMQIMGLNDETTISCNFEFFERYLRNAMQMMNNRVYLLIDYENANRNLEKAKTGSKKQSGIVC